MAKFYNYYVLDDVSETILGTFVAKSEAMASRIMKGFDFKKANLAPDDISVYRDPNGFEVYETYDTVNEFIGVSSNELDLQHQPVLDFEEGGK